MVFRRGLYLGHYFSSKLKNVIFADDTNLLLSDENISELFQ